MTFQKADGTFLSDKEERYFVFQFEMLLFEYLHEDKMKKVIDR